MLSGRIADVLVDEFFLSHKHEIKQGALGPVPPVVDMRINGIPDKGNISMLQIHDEWIPAVIGQYDDIGIPIRRESSPQLFESVKT